MPRLVPLLVLLAAGPVVGCGGGPAQGPTVDLGQQANGRLEAMKALADAVERKAPDGELAGLVEGLVSNALDPKTHPAQAREFVDVYAKRVKGKLKGDTATMVKGIVDDVERGLKG